MNDLPPSLIEQADNGLQAEEDLLVSQPGLLNVNTVLCKCGQVVNITMPTRCLGCGDKKSYWRTADKRCIKISDMNLGHLTSSIKYLAEKMEKAPAFLKTEFEVALDLLYEELGSRDKETKQLSGIRAALFKSL